MLMRMPVRMVARGRQDHHGRPCAAGSSSVADTLSQSRLTEATPNAVFISMGQTEQMKMTKMPEMDESFHGVERERHPRQRADGLEHLDERVERAASAATCR